MQDPIEYSLADTVHTIKFMIDELLKWHSNSISLFVDLEGTDLGLHTSSLSLMSIYHKSTRHTYLVVVSELTNIALNTTGVHKMTLKSVLEYHP